MADLAVHHIATLAKPVGQFLLFARAEVSRNEELRAVFLKYKGKSVEEGWAEKLADEMEVFIADIPEIGDASVYEVSEVAQYLADEYLQVGDAALIIDSETGLSVGKISEEDLWTPDLVPREDGTMAQPLTQLRPEIQARLIQWKFELGREVRIVRDLTARLVQTDADREGQDRRLLVATRGGRASIVEELRGALPLLFPNGVGGSLLHFVNLFNVTMCEPKSTDGLLAFHGLKAYAKVVNGIQDGMARNMSFDYPTTFRAGIAAQWARDMARTVTGIVAAEKPPEERDLKSAGQGVWVASPDEALMLQMGRQLGRVLPVEGCTPTLFTGKVGHLVIGNTDIASRELHDRWEIAATVEYTLYLDVQNATSVTLTGIPQVAHRAVLV